MATGDTTLQQTKSVCIVEGDTIVSYALLPDGIKHGLERRQDMDGIPLYTCEWKNNVREGYEKKWFTDIKDPFERFWINNTTRTVFLRALPDGSRVFYDERETKLNEAGAFLDAKFNMRTPTRNVTDIVPEVTKEGDAYILEQKSEFDFLALLDIRNYKNLPGRPMIDTNAQRIKTISIRIPG